MIRPLPLCLLLTTLLGGCAVQTPQFPAAAPTASAAAAREARDANPQLAFRLASGTYQCEYGARVEVRRDSKDPNQIQLGWQGVNYPMLRNASSSGLPRYEDAGSGLVWIDLPWKSLLLDGKSGKPLVSDCRGT